MSDLNGLMTADARYDAVAELVNLVRMQCMVGLCLYSILERLHLALCSICYLFVIGISVYLTK